ncbi:hypothetical protein [Streptomyces beihaiensis]|uniref:Uncharacterized protein n=1 Tax=Streptomyces beihaiensis TaxID=2984495 RepID=A0ABT3TQR5_9ACTN|nr:hypothetical protein [Streptomyces beihaiensis]MCX3059100.1 hypothetical protein [Streptomyces beihaiensis]
MPFLNLFTAVVLITLEQLAQWRYGPAGLVGLLLLAVGARTRSTACSSLGAVLLALVVAGPTLQ